MHFAEEPIIRGGDEDGEEDGENGDRSDEEDEKPPFPMEKQRLIRKDTPHYKKHFKITKLPKPETVAALLQGFSPDGLNSPTRAGEEEDEEDDDQTAPLHHPRMEELGDSRLQVNSSQVKVKGERLKYYHVHRLDYIYKVKAGYTRQHSHSDFIVNADTVLVSIMCFYINNASE